MVGIPDNAPALLILVAFVLPGVVYQSVRSRLRGPTPDELNATTKVLRATAVSTVLMLSYGVGMGPTLRDATHGRGWLYGHPRSTAALGLVLLFLIPSCLAVAEHLWARWRDKPEWGGWDRLSQYDPTPTAWDFAFREREPCFLRVLTDDGRWVGGWFDASSYASSFPQERELFIAHEWVMGEDGEFEREVTGSRGAYMRCDDARVVEFLESRQYGADRADDTIPTSGDTGSDELKKEA